MRLLSYGPSLRCSWTDHVGAGYKTPVGIQGILFVDDEQIFALQGGIF